MFRGFGIAVVALGLASASAQAQEQTPESKNHPANQQTQPLTPELPSPLPVAVIEGEEAAEARERREREASQREKDDLIAQQRMADATEAMNKATQSIKWAAWFSFGAVLAGTCLLIWTLLLTRSANAAAQAAVYVTREMGIAQARAYLHVSAAEVRYVGSFGAEHKLKITPAFDVVFFIENAGNTPAQWFEFGARSQVLERLEEGGVEISTVEAPLKRWGRLSPHETQTVPLQCSKMLPQYAEACATTSRHIRVSGTLSFKTEFDEIRSIPFDFHIYGSAIVPYMGLLEESDMVSRPIPMQRPTYQDKD